MIKKKGFPEVGELAVCHISRVNPHSAFAVLEEYGIEGMIHISEVSRGWVRDIRQFVRLNEMKVAKIIGIDDKGRVSLSLKRVSETDKNRKMKSYRLEQRAGKMLQLAAQALKRTEEQEDIALKLQEGFGSVYDGLLALLQKPGAVEKRIPAEWASALKEIVEKNIEQKEFEFRARLTIKTFKPNGVYIIKNILSEAERMRLSVHYIAAPSYLVKYKSKNAKKGEKEFLEKLGRLAENKDAEVSFAL